MLSAKVNSKCCTVFPTLFPTDGWSMITAFGAGATVGIGAVSVPGPELDSCVDAGATVVSGKGVKTAATVGWGRLVDSPGSVGCVSTGGTSVDATVDDESCAEFGRASVAEVPQANIPTTTAISGRASSRDIYQSI